MGDATGNTKFIVSAIFIILALVPMTLFRTREPEHISTERLSLPRLFSISWAASIGCFGAGLMVSTFYSLGPAAAERLGLTTPEVSAFMIAGILGGAFLPVASGAAVGPLRPTSDIACGSGTCKSVSHADVL